MDSVRALSHSQCGRLEELNDKMKSLLCLCNDVNVYAKACIGSGLNGESRINRAQKLYDQLSVFVVQAIDIVLDIKAAFNIAAVVIAVDKLECSLAQLSKKYRSNKDTTRALMFCNDGLRLLSKCFSEIRVCSEDILGSFPPKTSH